ncbi:MAG: 16S rRNA (guanine(527)-N(7))-methyltransferase RsmG [Rhodocyclaceae bacterium]|nr:16S rRNA (guanine(527)-N(7))-methyltransferase RsmG [Rhodocyclaceae bacterium]MBX3669614.1 16S rRNA (guanine(527)-N(7))-methyltransferase RsmG [Rhodocyclaceae bacterium]
MNVRAVQRRRGGAPAARTTPRDEATPQALQAQAPQLAAGIAALGLALDAERQQALIDFLLLLAKWNRTYNLTALSAAEEMLTHHLLDALAVLPHLGVARRIIDVGSGAGVPAIPIAIARPDVQVVSVDTVDKKIAFQRQARIELKLHNLELQCARVETLRLAGADIVIARAFAELAEFVSVAGHLAAPGGALLAMKGTYPQQEIEALPPGWRLERSLRLSVPGLNAERHLIWLRKN